MDIHLSPELTEIIRDKVSAGRYQSPDDVLAQALQLLVERDWVDDRRLEDLRQEVALGLDQANCGDVAPLDIEAIKAEGRRRASASGPRLVTPNAPALDSKVG